MRVLMWLVLATGLGLYAGDANEELLAASRSGDLAAVRQLIEKGAAIEAKTAWGQTPLYLAAMNGHEEVVRLLLEKGAGADVKDTFYKASALDFALARQHYGVAKMLVRKGAGNPDEVLASVAGTGKVELVVAFLEARKPSQAALDKAYESALDQKQAEVAALLKKAGAREPAPAFVADPKTLQAYAGTYKSEQLPLDIKAFVKEGRLYMQATGQSEFSLKAQSATQFEFAQYGIQVEFDSASSFTLKQGPGSYKFKKAVTQ
jgi:hypothetical protein